MPIKFNVHNKATIKPGSLPCPGGEVDITFKASSGHVLLRARYLIVGSAPYKFTAAPEGAKISPKSTSVTFDHVKKKGDKMFSYPLGPLTITRDPDDKCPGTTAALPIRVEVKEITKKKQISKTARKANGRIAILSAALAQMHAASGKSKTAFAKDLSAQLAAEGKKLSASAIQDAMAGVKSSAKTNEILGSILK